MTEIIDNNHPYVDLGLPSGNLWAQFNLGASSDTEDGFYFQWGDIKGYHREQIGSKKRFERNKTPFFKPLGFDYFATKYNVDDQLMNLSYKDDAARRMWKGDWQIPTQEDFEELYQLPHKWTAKNNTYGLLIEGKNNQTLFINANGFANIAQRDNVVTEINLRTRNLHPTPDVNRGPNGHLIYNYKAITFNLDENILKGGISPLRSFQRHFGHGIRPIIKTK